MLRARNGNNLFFVAACSALLLLSYELPFASAADADIQNLTTVSIGHSPLFQIVTGWQGLSASARAAQMQANLESALRDAPSAASVDVRTLDNGAAAIYANNRYIGTADAGDAAALNTTPTALADAWASSISSAFARQNASVHFVALPAGLTLPVYLSASSASANGLESGSAVEALTAREIALPEGNTLSAGTKLYGRVLGDERACTGSSCHDSLTIAFDTMVLADGTHFPISSRPTITTPSSNSPDKAFLIQLNERAQIAASGSVL